MSDRTSGLRPPLPPTVSRGALLVSGSDAEFRQLIVDTLAFSVAIQNVRNRLGQVIELSGTQYTILMAIARLVESEPELGVNQLAEHLHLSGAFVTIEVNKLVALHLVSKSVNPADRRRVVLSITDLAHAKLTELARIQQPANDTLFESLSAEEFETFRNIMAKLSKSGEKTLALIDYISAS